MVCEIKAGTGAYGVGGQIFAYMAELRPVAAAAEKAVRGIIISGVPDSRIGTQVRDQAERTGLRVDWYCYQASSTLHSLVRILATADAPDQEADRDSA